MLCMLGIRASGLLPMQSSTWRCALRHLREFHADCSALKTSKGNMPLLTGQSVGIASRYVAPGCAIGLRKCDALCQYALCLESLGWYVQDPGASRQRIDIAFNAGLGVENAHVLRWQLPRRSLDIQYLLIQRQSAHCRVGVCNLTQEGTRAVM